MATSEQVQFNFLRLSIMNILAIETSSSACSVALTKNNQVTARHKVLPMQQAQLILPMIDEVLKEADITLNQLDAIAFGCGPGSFTGIRIATSTAQGLGYALNLPLIPVSSLAALAQTAFNAMGWTKLLVAIDARMQEVYWGKYIVNSAGLVELQGEEIISPPSRLPSLESFAEQGKTWVGVGSAWQVFSEQIPFSPLEKDVDGIATAEAVLQLAMPRFQAQQWVRAEEALPVYLRDNVAAKAKKP